MAKKKAPTEADTPFHAMRALKENLLLLACSFALQLFNGSLSLIGAELLFKALLCLLEGSIA